MKLTIVAATGGIGRHLLDQALAAGHDVTAVVRDPDRLARAAGAADSGQAGTARIVAADLSSPEPDTLADAVRGGDAVLSGLGPRSRADTGVTAPGTRAIVAAMQASGVRRLVVVSAAPVGTVASPGRPRPPRHDPGDGPVMRHLLMPILRAALRRHYADLAEMEDVLRRSGLDWTSVRPPRLTGKPLTGRYRTAVGRNVRRGLTISRADVAHHMLQVIDQPDTFGQTTALAY